MPVADLQWGWIAAFAVLCHAAPAQSQPRTVEVRTSAELTAAARQASPGTTIRLAPGEYRGGVSLANLRGRAGAPIVITARDSDHPPVFVGGASGLHLTRPRHVELRDLILQGATGNGLNIDDGGDSSQPAEHILLTRLTVRDVGPQGNRDGIKLSGVDQFRISDCVVERWGNGGSAVDMVGCHQGEIAGCTFRHRADINGNGVQTKGGSADIAIRRCRFENAGGRAVNVGGSTGRDYFRPRSARYEAKNITVEDCTFVGSQAPLAFVGVDGAVVRYNTIYRPGRWVFRILQETQDPEFVPSRNAAISNNLIVFRMADLRSAINVGSGTSPETFTFAGNHWFCEDGPTRGDRLGLPTPETDGRYGVDPQFVDAERGDLRVQPGSPVRDAGVRQPVAKSDSPN